MIDSMYTSRREVIQMLEVAVPATTSHWVLSRTLASRHGWAVHHILIFFVPFFCSRILLVSPMMAWSADHDPICASAAAALLMSCRDTDRLRSLQSSSPAAMKIWT
jgi:hypothetical protein